VVPGVPHHVTQRGSRRMDVFFGEGDFRLYVNFMAEWCARCGVEVWAYCLMPNHVHLIAVPETEDSLARAVGEVHRRYSRRINDREDWRGHLWQGRFSSCPMDEAHTLQAARYVELNPVRAGLARRPWDYGWSSAAAHADGANDILVKTAPLLDRVEDWRQFVEQPLEVEQRESLRTHARTGRPLGSDGFVKRLERQVGRRLRPCSPGRPPRTKN